MYKGKVGLPSWIFTARNEESMNNLKTVTVREKIRNDNLQNISCNLYSSLKFVW
jgi:hypothetical protein